MDDRKNANRFKGFASVYDSARPQCPNFVVDFLSAYLSRQPETIVDIGCGTGLSTLIWAGYANSVIGIDPSDDMLTVARSNAQGHPSIRFMQAFSDDTALPESSADIVTCSQSFHWMNPETTLPEIARILKTGGIFAAYDCDWPPTCSWTLEQTYERLFDEVSKIEDSRPELKDSFKRWNKSNHLDNIKKSGHFRYAREIVFHNAEPCDASRYKKLALSQGGLQALIRAGITDIDPYLAAFEKTVDEYFKVNTAEILFSYRMRIGIK